MNSEHDPTACDCWRLTQTLFDAVLPDHVCLATMQETVRSWAHAQWNLLRNQTAMLATQQFFQSGHLTNMRGIGAALEAFRLLQEDHPTPYPLPWQGRQLGLVVRQWALGDSSPTLASQLASDIGWRRVLSSASASATSGMPFESVIDQLEHDLRRSGLPANPSVLGYAIQLLRGVDQPLPPSHGALVTTFAYVVDVLAIRWMLGEVRSNESSDMQELIPQFHTAFEQGFPGGSERVRELLAREHPYGLQYTSDYEVTGPLEWTSGPLFEQVQAVVLKHRDFTRKLAQHPQNTITAVRKAQAAAFRADTTDPDRFNYVAEALNRTDKLLDKQLATQLSPYELVTDYLDKVQERVARRRKRAGLPPEIPPNWRDQLRPHLLRLLAQR